MNEFLKLKYSQVRFLFLLKSIMAIAMRHSSVILLMAILCRASSVCVSVADNLLPIFSSFFFFFLCYAGEWIILKEQQQPWQEVGYMTAIELYLGACLLKI